MYCKVRDHWTTVEEQDNTFLNCPHKKLTTVISGLNGKVRALVCNPNCGAMEPSDVQSLSKMRDKWLTAECKYEEAVIAYNLLAHQIDNPDSDNDRLFDDSFYGEGVDHPNLSQ